MALFVRNISRNFIIFHPTSVPYQLGIMRSKLSKFSLTVQVEFMQPTQYVHHSNVFSSKKMDAIKAKLKEKQYQSERKQMKVCDVWSGMTLEELGEAMGKDADHVFKLLSFTDTAVDYDSPQNILDWNTTVDILKKARMRFRQVPKPRPPKTEADLDVYPRPPADHSKLKRRPPVITIMGHVDHGKTTLLDYLRKSSIVDSEFGGITQHIGAFSVKVNSDSITFLDTPGHAAFKAMRSRGAHCTDIVVLVVAADDGVMEQTEESIRMARDANVPIIVAINKIDKGNADIERTKKMLSVQGLVPDDCGGDVQCVPISALKGTNIDALTEAILTQAELSDLRADPDGPVEGVIIESKVDTHRGKLSTALIQRGTLKEGCYLTAGLAWCKVRRMMDEKQNVVKKASPSTPIEIIGWRSLPIPGDIIIEVESEKRAHEVVEFRGKKAKKKKLEEDLPEIERQRKEHLATYKPKLEERRKLGVRKLRTPPQKEKVNKDAYTGPQLNIVVKSDVEGSLEALLDCLGTYYDPRCRFDVVSSGVGNVTINDVEIAEIFKAVVYNFNVDVLPEAAQLADQKNIPIRPFNIIYRFLEDVKKEINSRLPLLEKEEVIAEAIVQELFLITDGKKKNVPVAGCRCVSGDLKKQLNYKVMRDGVEVHRDRLSSMKNQKTEVTAIKKDQECGLRFNDTSFVFKPGDVIQAYRTYTVPQEIEWNPY